MLLLRIIGGDSLQLEDGQAVQLEDGTTAYIHTPKGKHLTPNNLIFSENFMVIFIHVCSKISHYYIPL